MDRNATDVSNSDETLTDVEILGLEITYNLADGHAYHGIDETMTDIPARLSTMWQFCEGVTVPCAERAFVDAFALLSGSPSIATSAHFKIAPTASNSIDIVAALLAGRRMRTLLVEPTFDNIALLMRRRGVSVRPIPEPVLTWGNDTSELAALLARSCCDALFIVDPNNPTGTTLDAARIAEIADCCALHGTLLVVDKSFRFYSETSFDLYALLKDAGVSFIVIEDTGKVWPTHDMKASIILASADVFPEIEAIYNETYLCHSRFALSILETCMRETHRRGLKAVVAEPVRRRRQRLREALAGSGLKVEAKTSGSLLPVEWMNCRGVGRNDLDLTRFLLDQGVSVLPGRNFFWASAESEENQWNVRLAMMKPLRTFERSVDRLASVCRVLQAARP